MGTPVISCATASTSPTVTVGTRPLPDTAAACCTVDPEDEAL